MPGQIDSPLFAGCHEFIKKGRAKLVSCVEDILDELGPIGETLKPGMPAKQNGPKADGKSVDDLFTANMSEQEKAIWTFLEHGINDIDTICSMCKLPAHHASSALTTLQLKGLIKSIPGNQFSRR